MSELKWFSKFTAAQSDKVGEATKMTLMGVLIDTTENKNAWVVEEDDFQHLAKEFIGKQLRVDHGEKVENVLGVITSTEIDAPHTEAKADWDPATQYPHIHYVAEITTKDDKLIIPIQMGYVTHVSPAVDARTILCAECKKPMEPIANTFVKTCRCEGNTKLLKDMSARELSVVCSPAYVGTVMKPYGFAAAVDDSLMSEEEILTVINDELQKREVHSSQ